MTGAPRTTYDWCAQNDDIAELLTLTRTISKWEDEIPDRLHPKHPQARHTTAITNGNRTTT
jgi:hypothetical protein